MKSVIFASILLASIISCSLKEGQISPAGKACPQEPSTTPKGILDEWTSDDCKEVIRISGTGSLKTIEIYLNGGAVCACDATVCGSDDAGSYLLQACGYSGGGVGDPGCANLTQRGGPYSISGNVLTFCGTTCSNFY